jgi:tRNA G46 methylase TrmB
LADPRSDWVALELRHDRVYSIFSRAVCEGAPNLCAMGGDAASVLRKRVRPESVSHVFVNFPEPPHHSGDANAVNEFHLLTPDFFRRTHAALVTGGGLTLFSDNHRYMRDLARTLAELTYDPEAGDDPVRAGEPLFAAEAAKPRAEERDALAGAAADVDGGASFENIEGVRLYRGVPGEGTGHLVHEQSYFDRFWEQGARTERFFAVVSKN